MRATSIAELAWLHDATVFRVTYDTSVADERNFSLILEADGDCGYAEWAGKKLIIVASDAVLMTCTAWGTFRGQETIGGFYPELSAGSRAKMNEARRQGLKFEGLEITIEFNSGSQFEIACKSLEIGIYSVSATK